VIFAAGVFLFGAMGLAIDGSHLYAERQMAQAAADAGAQAGIRSIYSGSNASGNTGYFSTSASATCSASDARIPCYYAQTMNGFNSSSDTVSYDFPSAATVGVSSSTISTNPNFPVYLLRVTVQRQVPTTLFKFITSSNPTVMASATGAIVSVTSPVPILVTHPTLSGALNLGGSGQKITICGGPTRSIQVNSSSATAMTWNGNPVVNLQHAGPPDPGNCTTGNGADFGDFGGPSNGGSIVTFGTTGQFIPQALPIPDPLANVSAPSLPSPLTWPTNKTASLAAGSNGCPTGSGGCTLYFPGYWTNDIQVKNQNAVFAPGVYYMYGSNFVMNSNSLVFMSQGLNDNTVTTTPTVAACCGTGQSNVNASVPWGGSGTTTGSMLFYFTGSGSPAATGTISITSNAGGTGSFLQGAPNASSYKGILFFVDRNAAAATHSIDGGATITMTGTIYTNNSLSVMQLNPAQYQTLTYQGGGTGNTVSVGEIITNVLSMQGSPNIQMNLNSLVSYTVDQLALVQ
jgi:Flp pilus assembly protein TadG